MDEKKILRLFRIAPTLELILHLLEDYETCEYFFDYKVASNQQVEGPSIQAALRNYTMLEDNITEARILVGDLPPGELSQRILVLLDAVHERLGQADSAAIIAMLDNDREGAIYCIKRAFKSAYFSLSHAFGILPQEVNRFAENWNDTGKPQQENQNEPLSKPGTKKEFRDAVEIPAYRKFNTWARGKIQPVSSNRQLFQLKLNKIDPNTLKKLNQKGWL